MTSRRLLLSALLATGCHATSADHSAATAGDRAADPAHAARLTITLTDLAGRPTPVGLPTRLQVDAPALPASGRVAVSWKALDGDSSAVPRDGTGVLDTGAGDDALTITLTAAARGAAALTLRGTIEDGSVHGKFSDRLFATRAGRFDGSIQ